MNWGGIALQGIHAVMRGEMILSGAITATVFSAYVEGMGNDLDAIERRIVLVMDDYHRMYEPAIHDLLDQLLRYPARSCHLVLVTRSDPPLAPGRLRPRGQGLEMRERDLRFTPEETRGASQSFAGAISGDCWPIGRAKGSAPKCMFRGGPDERTQQDQYDA